MKKFYDVIYDYGGGGSITSYHHMMKCQIFKMLYSNVNKKVRNIF
jgi:hypothetical protein